MLDRLRENIKGPNWRVAFALIVAAVVSLSIFAAVGDRWASIPNAGEIAPSENEQNHFSVVWRGFIPDYEAQYPDYYICINDLVASSLVMNIRLLIQNQEASGYYFKVSAHVQPPSGWAVPDYLVGYIGVDEKKQFVYQMERTKPSSIPEGIITESVNLRVSAYYDASYSDLYSYDNFTVTFHFIDRTSPAWTLVYYNDFDDGTTQGWTGGQASTNYYRSFRYSLYGSSLSKDYYIGADYQEAYMIFAVRFTADMPDDKPEIYIDGKIYFRPDVAPKGNIWYQFVVPLHLGTTNVRIYSYSRYMYIDDVYVVAK